MSETIRVLRVISDLQVGGVQRQMMRSARYLRQNGVETEICCQRETGPLRDDFEKAGFPVHFIPFKKRLDPKALWNLRRLGRRGGFHIVHAHQYQSNLAANVAFLGCRRVHIINSYHSVRPVYSGTQALQLKLTKCLPGAIIAVSEAVREPLLNLGVPRRRIVVIHNGVEVPSAPARFPEQLPQGPLQLLYAGRFVKQKRLEMLVDVIRACRDGGVPVHLTLLGDGPVVGRVKRRIREQGVSDQVRLEGVSHDVPGWLAKKDLYISVSEREGFANALLECCAQGRGFVASDIPPHREMAGNSGCGILVPDNLEEWVKTLKELEGDRSKVREMGRAAFERVQIFSDAATARKYLELYQRVLGKETADVQAEPQTKEIAS